MGHERLGLLPRTRQWKALISNLEKFTKDRVDIDQLSDGTLENVRSRFKNIPNDKGVNAAFTFIVALSYCSRLTDPRQELLKIGIDASVEVNSLQVAKELSKWVEKNIESREYGELAKAAAIDAIAHWHKKLTYGEDNLFGKAYNNEEVWRKAGNGSGFCEISRLFFAKFTERYICYFLEREASAFTDGRKLRLDLANHVNEISKHAFETAKITQSFAAGWYNKNTKLGLPTSNAIKGFLAFAFGKLREELRRQKGKQ